MGVRGIPANHGGFETFVEQLCLYLVEKGWKVTVYCQEYGKGAVYESVWKGITRVHIPVQNKGAFGTVIFDLKSIWLACKRGKLHLTLGYNTACFNILQRIYGIVNIINMDGIEWKRQKWSGIGKVWFWLNERAGCWFGNHLIADHPKIECHIATRVSRKKITMIAYGGKEVLSADDKLLVNFGLKKDNYAVVIARGEPENSILEIIRAFSKERRDAKLVVLGDYNPEVNPYHKLVMSEASDEVVFLGAIYDTEKVSVLRFFARFYVHGHQVGGTNPSLVEALGAGNAVLAHENLFNRWVANRGAVYFSDVESAATEMSKLFSDDEHTGLLKAESRDRFNKKFRWNNILLQYEQLLASFSPCDNNI